jgi:hypothetical protein
MREHNDSLSTSRLSMMALVIPSLIFAVSCSGSDDVAQPMPGTTDGSMDVPQQDGGASTPEVGLDANASPAAKPDRLVLKIDNQFDKGAYSLSGTVTLPAPPKPGVRAILAIQSGFGDEPPTFRTLDFAAEFQTTVLKGGAASIPFVVNTIGPGNYFLSLVVDQNADLFVPGPGDFGGFYAGTPTKPIGHNEQPTLITVKDRDLSSLDFFVGPIVCLASYGETCSRDDDCRGTTCTGESEIVDVREGACFQGRCREAPSCPMPTDKRDQGSCFLD